MRENYGNNKNPDNERVLAAAKYVFNNVEKRNNDPLTRLRRRMGNAIPKVKPDLSEKDLGDLVDSFQEATRIVHSEKHSSDNNPVYEEAMKLHYETRDFAKRFGYDLNNFQERLYDRRN